MKHTFNWVVRVDAWLKKPAEERIDADLEE